MTWVDVGALRDLPERGARVVRLGATRVAVFRTGGGRIYALLDACPHRGGPLSQGIVHGERVTCPLHEWVIDLTTGRALGADEGCTTAFAVRVVDERVLLDCPALDGPAPAARSREAADRAKRTGAVERADRAERADAAERAEPTARVPS